ncbi:Gon-4-like protein [Plakobranchus ocellatus]|uniref:Gon-4-like protein n=1 Tax=Plakobranchus ocellatus TaxID=259542 RepID=A0AAV4DPQ9_9GAST|nr:Gon-4-like protein [Plakobranchus ocellatus]
MASLEMNQTPATTTTGQDSSSSVHKSVPSPTAPSASTTKSGKIGLDTDSAAVSPAHKNLKRAPEQSPTKLKTLAPKSLFTESVEYIPLPKISKKKAHQNHVIRPILPKPYIYGQKLSSPTKTAAMMLKKRATLVCQHRSPVKILPKRPSIETLPVPPTFSRVFTRSQGSKGKVNVPPKQQDSPPKENVQVELAPDNSVETGSGTGEIVVDSGPAIQAQGEVEEIEKDEDQMQLEDLMAACTTIRYDPKKSTQSQESDIKSKTQKRKDICLSLLEEDILETDPKKDERDTEYAKDYFNRVKHVLQDDPDRFHQFLTILHEMNKGNSNPATLYGDIAAILHDHQDLVEDFASFLLSHQAVECGCFGSYFQYQQLREFLRKLEIYCEKTSTPFQRTLKVLSKWLTLNQEADGNAIPFKERVSASLKNVPGILDELFDYFLDGQLPDSQSDEFEEVDLEAANIVSGFEEITLPACKQTNNTRLCACHCHQDVEDRRLHRRTRHCFLCSLKLYNGMPVLRMSKREYRPLTVIYPHEEREKLKKAKREAAQLALAKAKAQRSGSKKDKSKSSSQKGNSKRLSVKRKQRRRVSKPRKPKSVPEDKNSDMKDDCNTEGGDLGSGPKIRCGEKTEDPHDFVTQKSSYKPTGLDLKVKDTLSVPDKHRVSQPDSSNCMTQSLPVSDSLSAFDAHPENSASENTQQSSSLEASGGHTDLDPHASQQQPKAFNNKQEGKSKCSLDKKASRSVKTSPRAEGLEQSLWTEDWDKQILLVAADDGVTETSVLKMRSLIPEKSLHELTVRAKQLLDFTKHL